MIFIIIPIIIIIIPLVVCFFIFLVVSYVSGFSSVLHAIDRIDLTFGISIPSGKNKLTIERKKTNVLLPLTWLFLISFILFLFNISLFISYCSFLTHSHYPDNLIIFIYIIIITTVIMIHHHVSAPFPGTGDYLLSSCLHIFYQLNLLLLLLLLLSRSTYKLSVPYDFWVLFVLLFSFSSFLSTTTVWWCSTSHPLVFPFIHTAPRTFPSSLILLANSFYTPR